MINLTGTGYRRWGTVPPAEQVLVSLELDIDVSRRQRLLLFLVSAPVDAPAVSTLPPAGEACRGQSAARGREEPERTPHFRSSIFQ